EWRKAWRQGGREALRSAGPAGRKSKLSAEQLAQVEKRAGQRRGSQRLPDGRVDLTAGRRGDPAGHRRGLPPRPCLVCAPRPVGLDLPATRAARDRTQRRGDRTLGQETLAATQKNREAPERADPV